MTGMKVFQQLVRDQRGSSAVEYGLILAMVFLAIVGAVTGLAAETSSMWTNVSNDMSTAASQARGV